MPSVVTCFSSPPVAGIVQIFGEPSPEERRNAILAPSGEKIGSKPRLSFDCLPPIMSLTAIQPAGKSVPAVSNLVDWYAMLWPSGETLGHRSRSVVEVTSNSSPLSIVAPHMLDSSLVLVYRIFVPSGDTSEA